MAAADEQRVINAVHRQLSIGGVWVDAADNGLFDVVDPSTGHVLTSVADAQPVDAMRALETAVRAQSAFATLTPRQRSDMLMSAFHLLHERIEDLALLMTLEMGKPLAEARGEVAYAAEFLRHFAEEAVRTAGDYQLSPSGESRILTMKQPVGPALLITPWNFPLAMGTRKLGPAIAAGCTSVIKPAEQAPLSMLALAQILHEAGVPNGAVNVVTTSRPAEIVEPLIRSGLARKLSFTGSTTVGRILLEQSAAQVMRTSMELGGNAPFIVFPDASFDLSIAGALTAKLRNGGEACTAVNRFYVHADILDRFAACLADRMRHLPVGRGVEDGVLLGPLIDADAVDKVQTLVDDAVQHGATLLTGGRRLSGPGYFYQPTVLVNVPTTARLHQEEIFGPVAAINAFRTEEEVVARANATEYGLVGYVYTSDLNRGLRVAEALETGMVGLNQAIVSNPAAPFGGVKASGIGREGGRLGIEEFLETKYVSIAVS